MRQLTVWMPCYERYKGYDVGVGEDSNIIPTQKRGERAFPESHAVSLESGAAFVGVLSYSERSYIMSIIKKQYRDSDGTKS